MLTLYVHELKYYMKNIHELTYIYGFYVILLLLFPMGLRAELHLLPELAPMLVWLGLVVAMGLGARDLFQRDSDSGVWEGYLQLRGAGTVVAAKWLAFYTAMLLPALAAVPLVLGLFQLPRTQGWGYAATIISGGAALSILATMAACVTVGLERGRAVAILLILPLAVPIVIFGSAGLKAAAAWSDSSILFMVAYSVFLIPILIAAGGSCLRASA